MQLNCNLTRLGRLARRSRSASPLSWCTGARYASFPRTLCAVVARRRRTWQLRSASAVLTSPASSSTTSSNTSTSNSSTSRGGFASLGLGSEFLSFLGEQGLDTPTEIQAAAFPQLLSGRDTLLASHTGSGKTLAYLLPLVKLLRDEEAREGVAARPRRPRALVLGPTRELTDQILRVAKALGHHARFRAACVNGGGRMGAQAAALERPLDVLVGTPQKLAQHAERGHLFWGDVRCVVLDEADTLLDAQTGFLPEVRAVLRPLRSKPHPASLVLVMATLSRPVQRTLAAEFPGLQSVRTQSLHRGIDTAAHTFLPVPGSADKLDVLAQVASGEQRRGGRAMVFCNTLDSARAVEYALRERGLATVSHHGDVPQEARARTLEAFTTASPPPLLVCTDLAARGLDVPSGVDCVINFDFPLNPVDFLHRTGRTARAGAPGRVTSLVTKRDATLAGRIERALAKGLPLDELSGDRARLPPDERPKPETLKRRAAERRAESRARKGVRGAARFKEGSQQQKPRPGARPRPGASAGSSARPRPGAGAGPKPGVGRSGRGRTGPPKKPSRGAAFRSTKR